MGTLPDLCASAAALALQVTPWPQLLLEKASRGTASSVQAESF